MRKEKIKRPFKSRKWVIGIDLGQNIGYYMYNGAIEWKGCIKKADPIKDLRELLNFKEAEVEDENTIWCVIITKPVRFYNTIVAISKQCGLIELRYGDKVEYISEKKANWELFRKGNITKEEVKEAVWEENEHIADAKKFVIYKCGGVEGKKVLEFKGCGADIRRREQAIINENGWGKKILSNKIKKENGNI